MVKTIIVEMTWTENTDPVILEMLPVDMKTRYLMYGCMDVKILDDDDGT